MEGGREEANAGQSHTLSSSCSENKTPDRTVIKTEPAEDYHQTPQAALGCSDRAGCTPGCSGNQKESSDGVCAGILKQEKTELGEGSVVMRGEDFWVEVDPAYESEDEPTVIFEVKVEPEGENESREIGLGVRFSGDKTGVSSDRQGQSSCPVSAGPPGMGGVAADSRTGTGVPVKNVHGNVISGVITRFPLILPAPTNTISRQQVIPVVVGPPPGVGSFPGMNVVPGSSRPNFGSRVSLGLLPGMVPTPTSSGTTGQGDSLKKNCTILPMEAALAPNLILIVNSNPRFAPVQKVRRTCVCCECGEKFDNDNRLREHGKTVHGNTKMYSCPECGKKFGYRDSLETHLATRHKFSGRYACSECGKQFSREGRLEDHLAVVHQDLKPLRQFTCHECGKKFGREKSLKVHTARMHRGEKISVVQNAERSSLVAAN